jgi:hypothetical protein
MIITICSSLYFAKEIGEVAEKLGELGHEVFVPSTAEQILSGQINISDIEKEKESGLASDRTIKNNAIIRHYKKIEKSEAILVLNYEKKGVKNYIGGNTFLETGFAFVLNKKIFLLNPIPEVNYSDEIIAMQPIILNGDLDNIK